MNGKARLKKKKCYRLCKIFSSTNRKLKLKKKLFPSIKYKKYNSRYKNILIIYFNSNK